MIRVLPLLVLIFSLLPLSCATTITDSRPQIIGNPDTQKELSKPPISEWRYELRTNTYTYLTKNLTKETYTSNNKAFNKYTLTTFWANDSGGGTKWVFHDRTIKLDEKYFGYISVSRAPDFESR